MSVERQGSVGKERSILRNIRTQRKAQGVVTILCGVIFILASPFAVAQEWIHLTDDNPEMQEAETSSTSTHIETRWIDEARI